MRAFEHIFLAFGLQFLLVIPPILSLKRQRGCVRGGSQGWFGAARGVRSGSPLRFCKTKSRALGIIVVGSLPVPV